MFYPFEVADSESGVRYRLTDNRLAELSLAPHGTAWSPGAAIACCPDPVWSESFSRAPVETIAAISTALEDLILATPNLRPPSVAAMPEGRAHRHLQALVKLWQSMGDALPEGLTAVRHVLGLPHGCFLKPLQVVEGSLDPLAPASMQALFERLRAEFGSVPAAPAADRAPVGSRLRAVQEGLTTAIPDQGPRDGSLVFYGLRDAAACADFAAARARTLIEQGTSSHEIAVMSCGDVGRITSVFAAQGVPLSGIPTQPPERDLVGETLYFLLLTKRPPAPTMALASLCLSPLMPWDGQTGRKMAEGVMAGKFAALPTDAPSDWHEFWETIRASAVSAKQLRFVVDKICARLQQKAKVRERLQLLTSLLVGEEGAPNWEAILREARVDLPQPAEPVYTRESVSYWPGQESPWRPCRHLIVTDFAGDLYPPRPAINPLFLDSELAVIAQTTGLHLTGSEERLERSLRLFESQLCAVTGNVTFLVPRRTLAGDRLAPCPGLSLIGRTIDGISDAAGLIDDLSSIEPEKWPVSHHVLPRVPERPPVPDALDFSGRKLLELRKGADKQPAPQSPSRLETLLVSPLAWLLDELDAQDLSWAAEELDVSVTGNIAHDVFEQVFTPEQTTLTDEELMLVIGEAYQRAVRRHAGFLGDASWKMERERLEQAIFDAAVRWRDHLRDLGARITACESGLQGEFLGVGLAGKADVILELGDNSRIVVDYKKSGTRKRRERMEAGWDLQAGLYARMLSASAVQENGNGVGIAYYLMNDGGLLTSGVALPQGTVAHDLGDGIDAQAIEHLKDRLEQLRRGKVVLNKQSDEKFFEKRASMTPYALGKSPLIRAFMRGDE